MSSRELDLEPDDTPSEPDDDTWRDYDFSSDMEPLPGCYSGNHDLGCYVRLLKRAIRVLVRSNYISYDAMRYKFRYSKCTQRLVDCINHQYITNDHKTASRMSRAIWGETYAYIVDVSVDIGVTADADDPPRDIIDFAGDIFYMVESLLYSLCDRVFVDWEPYFCNCEMDSTRCRFHMMPYPSCTCPLDGSDGPYCPWHTAVDLDSAQLVTND
ncbi:hypothetical protein MCOR25_007054 [Pyricularia grisea]|uniref:Uncharacterized protein n=1 Tax=Pyricularia grisea TaxID=148305 RepID=A0A6P8AZZ2_PYRGI|nr:hypothetical protein PgNI_10863 [Pyricularia grisea]KAI6359481.1 hypothetical protein MCOR25_007054 [Pyricularia grisea]TLD07884.1 hypothetical protein PgNI_10863 [Pyricularia grisea]